jgi:MFS family permease
MFNPRPFGAPWRAAHADTARSPFVRLWLSVVAASFADGVVRVLLPLFAVASGATAVQVSVVVAASSLPWLLGTMPAGVIADRFNRARTIRVASLCRVLVALALFGATRSDTSSVAVLAVSALLFGGPEVITDVASQTEVASVVDPDRLERAYGRMTSGQLAAELLIGPAFAGAVFQWNPSVAVAATTISFAIAGLAIGSNRRTTTSPASTSRWWRDASAGLRVLASHQWMRRSAITAGVLNFTSAGSAAILVTYALSSDGLDLSERDFGLLLTATGIGGVVGALAAPRIHARLGDDRSLLVGVSGFVLADIAPGLVRHPAMLAFASATGFAVGMIYTTKVVSLRQRLLNDEIRGRVNAASQLVGTSTAPLGAIVAGLLATGIGFRPTFLALGAVASLGVLASHPWTNIPEPQPQAPKRHNPGSAPDNG